MQAWQATVQDDRGNAVPNPVVTVYLADGVTEASIYNESGTSLPNPLTGDVDGFVQFYAAPGSYKVEGAGTEQWEVEIGGGGSVFVEYYGDTSLASTWTAALEDCGRTGRSLKGLSDYYTVSGTIIGNHFAAMDFDNITTIRRAAPGAPLFLTVGFESFADDVRRGYSWYSSITARNAAGRSVGDYVMVAPAQSDFFNATWWRAIAAPSNVNSAWVEVEPVSGQVGGLYRNVRFDGGDSAGATDLVCGIYGVDTILHQFRAEGGGISLHTESPGSLFSTQVNRNLMWSINDIEVRNASALGWYANHQSDGSIYGTVAFLRDNVVGTILRIGAKASGTKWLGGHTWGGLAGSDIVIDGASNTMVGFEHERHVKVQAGGFQFFGQAYRINNASREDGAAFVISPNLYDIKIQGKIAHFRHPVQVLSGSPLVGADINLTYYSEDASAAPVSPTGQGVSGVTGTSNRARIVRTGSGGGTNLHTDDSRRRPAYLRQVVEVPYASSITLDSGASQVFRIAQLTGNTTVNITGTPQNGDTIEILFTQDSVGGRTVSWGSGIAGGFTDGGSGFWRRSIVFTWHGAVWLRSGGTGAWLA